MPTTKSPTKHFYRSPIICCTSLVRAFQGTLLHAVFLSVIIVFLICALALVFYGALHASKPAAFYFCGTMLFLLATALACFYVWLKRRFRKKKLYCNHRKKMEQNNIATIDGYYNQLPAGLKSDYPMGPHLIMTLPRPSRARTRGKCNNVDQGDSKSCNSVTPGSIHKKYLSRLKNIPPLASEETLSPSLYGSSYGSINSVV